MRTYRQIAHIQLFHGYYTDEKLPDSDLLIEPTADSLRVLANYRISLRAKGNDIKLMQEYEKTEDAVIPLIAIDELLAIRFVIRLKNNDFISFTQMPFIQMSHEAFYFTNYRKGTVLTEGVLTLKNTVTHQDLHTLLPKGADRLTPFLNGTVEVTNKADSKRFELDTTDENQFGKQLAALSNGVYTLKTANKQQADFILNKGASNSGMIGFIDLCLDANVCTLVDTQGEGYNYSVHFAPRSTYRRYEIVEKYNSVKNVKVVDEHDQVKFELESEEQKGKTKTIVLTAQKQLPLQKEPKEVFKLMVNNGNGSPSKVLLEKLPHPKLKNISKHTTVSGEYVSTSYLYI